MELSVEAVTDKNLNEYEAFVKECPKGHFMQSRMWGYVKPNWKWEGLICRGSDGKIKGTLGVLIRRVPGLPVSLMYAARGPVCDINDFETLSELTLGAREMAARNHAFEMKIDPDILSSETRFLSDMESLGYRCAAGSKNFEDIQPRYVFRLDVKDKTTDEIMAMFNQKTRYNIRLAERKGVVTRIGGEDDAEAFAEIMKTTGERDGFITRGAAYFRNMLRALGENARLYMAYSEDKAIAGTLAVHYGDKVWYLYGASSNEHRNLMPNYLLQWEMIQWAVEEKCAVYDFRGVSGDISEDNPLYGLYRFKKGFGGDFCEFTGELSLIINKPLYTLINFAQKNYRVLRRKLRTRQ